MSATNCDNCERTFDTEDCEAARPDRSTGYEDAQPNICGPCANTYLRANGQATVDCDCPSCEVARLRTVLDAVRAIVDGEPEVTRWVDGQRLIDRDKIVTALGATAVTS